MPASTMRTSTSGSREAGPIVATIFVRRIRQRTVHTSPRGRVDNVAAMSIETEDELEGLRRAGHVVAVVLRELRRRVQAGVSTAELDRVAGRHGIGRTIHEPPSVPNVPDPGTRRACTPAS